MQRQGPVDHRALLALRLGPQPVSTGRRGGQGIPVRSGSDAAPARARPYYVADQARGIE